MVESLGASPRSRRRFRARRATAAPEGLSPSSLSGTRVTLVAATALASREEAERALERLRSDRAAREETVARAVRDLNGLLHAHRAAAGDPLGRDVAADRALAVRVGFGTGEQVADGRSESIYELPLPASGRRDLLAPLERLTGMLAGRHPLHPSEELVLRARADLGAGRTREAALQARVALECLLAELGSSERSDPGLPALTAARAVVSEAAGAAVTRELSPAETAEVGDAVAQMTAAVRRRAIDET